DSVLWIGPLFLAQWMEGIRANLALSPRPPLIRFLPLATWLAAAIVVLPWLIFSVIYFGSPFPNTVFAKTVAYVVEPGSAFTTLFARYANPFFETLTVGATGALILALLYLVLALTAMIYAARRAPRLLPLLIYPWLYLAVFSLANPLIFRWYVVPPLPGLMLGIAAGAWVWIERLQKAVPRRRAIIPVAVGALAALWIVMSLRAWTLHPDQGAPQPAPLTAWNQIELDYEGVANTLRDQFGVTPDTVVASADIGTIGYFTRARIIDTVGLVTPALSKYYPFPPEILVKAPDPQNYAIPPRLILDTQPDYLVTMEAFVRLGLEKDAAFKAEYGDPVVTVPTDFYGTDMRAYKRR
ncbi:MAG TPA: hypothetical protein VMT34_14750, partial [Aggregatilineales bacterium]|nr:hypothetical protein [Aggregatilineales bacterium]